MIAAAMYDSNEEVRFAVTMYDRSGKRGIARTNV